MPFERTAKSTMVYSSATLAMGASLQSTSLACYRQLLDSGSVTLPSAKHLKWLTSGLNIDTGKLNQSTVSYLKARFDKCEQKDKCVSLVMDEVHCKKSVQYVGGKVYGIKDDQVTKTLLCVMVKSVASKRIS